MTATAGFDLVMEIGSEAIRDAIRANVVLGGVRLNPPFEMQNPFGPLPLLGSGVSYTIVNSMSVTLEGERGVRMVLGFADSSVENDDPTKFTVYGLAGTVSILLQLQLIDSGPFLRTIGYEAATATVTVTFAPPSLSAIDTALSAAGLGGIGTTALIAQAQQALLSKLGSTPTPIPGFSFRVTPGTNGGLFPSLQFERLELRNVGAQAIGIFGNCRVADHNRGDPSTLTQRPLPAGQNIRVTLAADAFHTLAFCPAMGAKLGVAPNAVPGRCGGGNPVGYGPGKMVWIDDRFTSGGIVVTGMVSSSSDCVKEATVDFRMPFSVSVAGGALAINPGTPSTGEPHVDYKWYCEVAAFFAGPIGIAAMEVGRSAIADIAGEAVKSAIGDLLKTGPGAGSGFALPNTSFMSVEMTAEALKIGGVTRFSIIPPDPPYVSVRGDVSLVYVSHHDGVFVSLPNPQLRHHGLVHIKRLCIDGEYPVLERLSRLEGRYRLETYRIPRPLNRAIFLDSYDLNGTYPATLLASTPLPANGTGEIVVPIARCTYPFPLPDGTVVKQPVPLSYTIDRRYIRLFNAPASGSFGLSLRLQIDNSAGFHEQISVGVPFVGDDVMILGSYSTDLAKCIKSIVDKVNSYALSTEPGPGDPIEHPRPDEIFAYVDRLQRSGNPGLAEISPFVRLSHQGDYLSADLTDIGDATRILTSIEE